MRLDDPSGRVPYEELEKVPGCGMAAYAGLLALFLLAGLTGMTLATGQILQAGSEAGPTKLRPGASVAVWQMKPLRQAGVVAIDEVPLAWHDETLTQDGSRACALMDDRLVRVEDEVGSTIRYADIADLQYNGAPETGSTVTIVGKNPSGANTVIACVFAPHDGGTRMHTQLKVERDRAQVD